MVFETNGVKIVVNGGGDKQAVFSARVQVGDLVGTGRCHATKSSALELARLVIEQYFSFEIPPAGSELCHEGDGSAIYIVPFHGVYVVSRRAAHWRGYGNYHRYDWVVESWHTTLEAARRAAARI